MIILAQKVIIILVVILKSLFFVISTENYSLEQSFIFKVILNVGYVGVYLIKISFVLKLTLRSQFYYLRKG